MIPNQNEENQPSKSSTLAKESKKNFNSFLYGTFSGLVCGVLYQPLEVLKINMIILPDDLFTNRVMRNRTYYG